MTKLIFSTVRLIFLTAAVVRRRRLLQKIFGNIHVMKFVNFVKLASFYLWMGLVRTVRQICAN